MKFQVRIIRDCRESGDQWYSVGEVYWVENCKDYGYMDHPEEYYKVVEMEELDGLFIFKLDAEPYNKERIEKIKTLIKEL